MKQLHVIAAAAAAAVLAGCGSSGQEELQQWKDPESFIKA